MCPSIPQLLLVRYFAGLETVGGLFAAARSTKLPP